MTIGKMSSFVETIIAEEGGKVGPRAVCAMLLAIGGYLALTIDDHDERGPWVITVEDEEGELIYRAPATNEEGARLGMVAKALTYAVEALSLPNPDLLRLMGELIDGEGDGLDIDFPEDGKTLHFRAEPSADRALA